MEKEKMQILKQIREKTACIQENKNEKTEKTC